MSKIADTVCVKLSVVNVIIAIAAIVLSYTACITVMTALKAFSSICSSLLMALNNLFDLIVLTHSLSIVL